MSKATTNIPTIEKLIKQIFTLINTGKHLDKVKDKLEKIKSIYGIDALIVALKTQESDTGAYILTKRPGNRDAIPAKNYFSDIIKYVFELTENRTQEFIEEVDGLKNTALIMAIRDNDEELTNFLLSPGINPNNCYEGSVNPLMVAVAINNYNIVRTLLYYGAKTDQYAINLPFCKSPLSTAVRNQNSDMINLLVEYGGAKIKNNPAGEDIEEIARATENPEILSLIKRLKENEKILIPNNVRRAILKTNIMELNKLNPDEITSFITGGGLNLLEFCLHNNLPDAYKVIYNRSSERFGIEDLSKSLSTACSQGKQDFVEILLNLGADVNYLDEESPIPNNNICHAITKKTHSSQILLILLQHGANPNNDSNERPINRAIFLEKLDLIPLIIENSQFKIDLNLKDQNGKTALMMAIEKGNLDLVKYLLQNGAKIIDHPNLKEEVSQQEVFSRKFLFEYSKIFGHYDITKFIQDYSLYKPTYQYSLDEEQKRLEVIAYESKYYSPKLLFDNNINALLESIANEKNSKIVTQIILNKPIRANYIFEQAILNNHCPALTRLVELDIDCKEIKQNYNILKETKASTSQEELFLKKTAFMILSKQFSEEEYKELSFSGSNYLKKFCQQILNLNFEEKSLTLQFLFDRIEGRELENFPGQNINFFKLETRLTEEGEELSEVIMEQISKITTSISYPMEQISKITTPVSYPTDVSTQILKPLSEKNI